MDEIVYIQFERFFRLQPWDLHCESSSKETIGFIEAGRYKIKRHIISDKRTGLLL